MQQKLGEIAEGDGLLLGDAALSQEEKNLGEGAVDVGGGGEVAAEGFELGCCDNSTGSGFCFDA